MTEIFKNSFARYIFIKFSLLIIIIINFLRFYILLMLLNYKNLEIFYMKYL